MKIRKIAALSLSFSILFGGISASADTYEAASGEASVSCAYSSNDSNITIYKSVLDRIYTALSEKWDIERLTDNDLNFYYGYQYIYDNKDPLEIIGYLFRDLDSDGTDELIIVPAGYDADKPNCFVYDIYTVKNGRPVRALTAWDRNTYAVCENGYIMNEGSNGASYYVGSIGKFSSKKKDFLITREFLYTDLAESANGGFKAFYQYYTDGTDTPHYGVSDKKALVSEKKADSILKKWYSYKKADLKGTPFAKYKTDGGTANKRKLSAREKKDYKLYKSVLDDTARAIKSYTGGDRDTDFPNRSYAAILDRVLYGYDDLSFCFTDLDKDGTDELLISVYDETTNSTDGNAFLDLYTYKNGKPYHVCSGNLSKMCAVTKDNKIIIFDPRNTSYALYKFKSKSKDVLKAEVFIGYGMDASYNSIPQYYTDGRAYVDYIDKNAIIPKDRAIKIWNKYDDIMQNGTKDLRFTPFSDYDPDDAL